MTNLPSRIDWCDVHQAMVPLEAVDPLPHCYEWWMREVMGDDSEPLDSECIVVTGRLVDRETMTSRLVREHLEMWSDVVFVRTGKHDESLQRALDYMGGPVDAAIR